MLKISAPKQQHGRKSPTSKNYTILTPKLALEFAQQLQASTYGMSLDDITEWLGTQSGTSQSASRSTAERALKMIRDMFDEHVEVVHRGDTYSGRGDRRKRWRLRPGAIDKLTTFTASERSELAHAEKALRDSGLVDRADIVAKLASKLKAHLPSRARNSVDTDFEALMESEGLARSPGPRPELATELLHELRYAILAFQRLRLVYRRRRDDAQTVVCVEPYGIIFGQRHYLVAYSVNHYGEIPTLYALGNIISMEDTGETFVRRDFDLNAFVSRSFGVFQEDPFQVIWRFSPNRAADVMEHHFHPNQTKTRMENGSIEVKFTAGGLHEMAWHLFTWGTDVEIIAPDKLRIKYQEMLSEVLARLATNPLSHPS
jgi:predicted DNA-binding transcriptional regulator YafY